MDTLLALQNSHVKVNVYITDDNGGRAKLNRKPISVEDGISRLRKAMFIPKNEMDRAQKFLYDGQMQYTFIDGYMAGDLFIYQEAF